MYYLRHAFPHLQRRASSGCPGISLPPQTQCSGFQSGRPSEEQQKTFTDPWKLMPWFYSIALYMNMVHLFAAWNFKGRLSIFFFFFEFQVLFFNPICGPYIWLAWFFLQQIFILSHSSKMDCKTIVDFSNRKTPVWLIQTDFSVRNIHFFIQNFFIKHLSRSGTLDSGRDTPIMIFHCRFTFFILFFTSNLSNSDFFPHVYNFLCCLFAL